MKPSRVLGVLALSLFSVLPFAACGKSGDDDATAGSSCAAYAQAYCTRANACGSGAPGSCVSVLTAYCDQALALPDTGLTPALVESCAAATSSTDCSTTVSCDSGVKGSRAPGAGCASSAQCSTGLCKGASTGSGKCGVCAVVPGKGDPCKLGDPCGEGNYCKTSIMTGDGTCEPLIPAGGACQGSGCVSGTICVSGVCTAPIPVGGDCSKTPYCKSSSCVKGVCTAYLGEGAACLAQTGNPGCDPGKGLTCKTTPGTAMGTCQTQYKLAGPGEACGFVADVQVQCKDGICKYTGGGSTGVCKAAIPYGGACSSGAGGASGAGGSTQQGTDDCGSGVDCIDGICQIPPVADCK